MSSCITTCISKFTLVLIPAIQKSLIHRKNNNVLFLKHKKEVWGKNQRIANWITEHILGLCENGA